MVRRRLMSQGNEYVPLEAASDIHFIFTCVVIQETERRMLRRIKEITALDIPLVVSGCLVTSFPEMINEIAPDALPLIERFPLNRIDSKLSLLPPRKLAEITTDQLEAWLSPGSRIDPNEIGSTGEIRNVEPPEIGEGEEGHELPTFSSGELFCKELDSGGPVRTTFIVPISQGCLGNCTYCITKEARGRLTSYLPDHILDLVTGAVGVGKMEIQLTSQDTGIYGRDMGISLPSLLDNLTNIQGDYRIRVGMMNPDGLKPILHATIAAFGSPNIFKFLHLPIQSGNDEILSSMGRRYRVSDVREILVRFREAIPELTLSTDIITGFPGETEEAFQDSLDIISELRPDLVNITRFSERKGTRALELPNKVHGRISKERSRKLTELRFRISAEKNREFIGRKLRVLVTEQGKERSVICRDDNYRSVVVKNELTIGEWREVEIVDATDVYLLGEII